MSERLQSPPVFSGTVYYADTDAGGVVYHANYLRFAEAARGEFLKSAGLTYKQLRDEYGLILTIQDMHITYHRPLMLEDQFTIHTRCVELSGASFVMAQTIHKDKTLCTSLAVKLVAVNTEGRILRLPKQLCTHPFFATTMIKNEGE